MSEWGSLSLYWNISYSYMTGDISCYKIKFIYLSTYLSIYLPTYLSTSLSIYLSIYLCAIWTMYEPRPGPWSWALWTLQCTQKYTNIDYYPGLPHFFSEGFHMLLPTQQLGEWLGTSSAFFFFRAFRGEISPSNSDKFRYVFGYFSHFFSPQKEFPPQNYISRKKTLGTSLGLPHCLPS